jgi:superoxide dismutase, Fe-Mn family
MSLTLAPLPFDRSALEPYMSAHTLDFHHGKHHRAYVDYTISAIKGTPLEGSNLDVIVKKSKESGDKRLFNNSAQAWNHDFFWQSISPTDGPAPTGKLADWLTRDFGGVDPFKQAFKTEAIGHFASGWAWLIYEGGKLRVTSYHDADTPIAHDGAVPILTVDLWEHAYYLDYQNSRANFLDAFLTHLVGWRAAGERLERALLGGDDLTRAA